jgi:hypothetical protein
MTRVEFCSVATGGDRLEEADLHGRGFWLRMAAASDSSRDGPPLGVGRDHQGPGLPVGLGLAGHGPAQLVGQVHVLDLDREDLDAPVVGDPGDDPVQLPVDRLALAEHRVQVVLAEDGPEVGLGGLADREQVVLHLHDRRDRLHHLA